MSSKELGTDLADKLFKNNVNNFVEVTDIIVNGFTTVFKEQVDKINDAVGIQNKINKTREADKVWVAVVNAAIKSFETRTKNLENKDKEFERYAKFILETLEDCKSSFKEEIRVKAFHLYETAFLYTPDQISKLIQAAKYANSKVKHRQKR